MKIFSLKPVKTDVINGVTGYYLAETGNSEVLVRVVDSQFLFSGSNTQNKTYNVDKKDSESYILEVKNGQIYFNGLVTARCLEILTDAYIFEQTNDTNQHYAKSGMYSGLYASAAYERIWPASNLLDKNLFSSYPISGYNPIFDGRNSGPCENTLVTSVNEAEVKKLSDEYWQEVWSRKS
jgi:hypothetical protein